MQLCRFSFVVGLYQIHVGRDGVKKVQNRTSICPKTMALELAFILGARVA